MRNSPNRTQDGQGDSYQLQREEKIIPSRMRWQFGSVSGGRLFIHLVVEWICVLQHSVFPYQICMKLLCPGGSARHDLLLPRSKSIAQRMDSAVYADDPLWDIVVIWRFHIDSSYEPSGSRATLLFDALTQPAEDLSSACRDLCSRSLGR